MLAVFFCAEGIMDLLTYLFGSKTNGAHWLLLHGIVTLLLGHDDLAPMAAEFTLGGGNPCRRQHPVEWGPPSSRIGNTSTSVTEAFTQSDRYRPIAHHHPDYS